jgi:hypothetical protein
VHTKDKLEEINARLEHYQKFSDPMPRRPGFKYVSTKLQGLFGWHIMHKFVSW